MPNVTIEIDGPRAFRVAGTASWARFCDAGLCAHDVFHHRLDDTGSMAEEAMSFGAQLWLEFPYAGLEGIHSHNLTGSLDDAYAEAPGSVDRFVIREHPPAFRLPPERFMERFRVVCDLGLREAVGEFDSTHRKRGIEVLPLEALDAFNSDENMERYVAWMAYGFRMAQRRFPDADGARQAFYRWASTLQRLPPGLASATFDFADDWCEFTLRKPLTDRTMGDVGAAQHRGSFP